MIGCIVQEWVPFVIAMGTSRSKGMVLEEIDEEIGRLKYLKYLDNHLPKCLNDLVLV